MMTCYLEKCAALHYFGAIFLAILHDEGFEDTYVFCISCPKNSLSKHTRNQRGRTEEALMMTRTHLTHSLKVIAFQASMSRWSGLKCSAPYSPIQTFKNGQHYIEFASSKRSLWHRTKLAFEEDIPRAKKESDVYRNGNGTSAAMKMERLKGGIGMVLADLLLEAGWCQHGSWFPLIRHSVPRFSSLFVWKCCFHLSLFSFCSKPNACVGILTTRNEPAQDITFQE